MSALGELSRVEPVERRHDYVAALVVFAANAHPEIDWRARIPREVVMDNNATMRGIARDVQIAVLSRMLRVRLGARARRYVKRLPDASTRALSRLERVIASAPAEDRLMAELDRLPSSD